MKKKNLNISGTFSLPIELAARTQAILAMKGVGKTYVGMKETEEMLKANQQVVCLDPTGVWWGLRSSADGKSEGFPIIIMGGDKADVPLEPTSGSVVADFVVDSGQSAILDMSHFESLAAQDRFVTDFAIRLYRRKGQPGERNTIHLMLDEADSFAPQNPGSDQKKMLGAWEAIVRRGRSRGIGLTMITQRPAVINKNVLSQVDLLVCLRIVGIHDFKAASDWTNLYATKKQSADFMQSLPQLKIGEAWFWSPGWLRIFKRTTVDEKETFDSSRTPEPGEDAITPKKAATIDLDKLSDAIKATVETAAKNDPAKLRQKIRELEAQVKNPTPPPQQAVDSSKQIRASTVKKLERQLEDAMKFIARINTIDFQNVPAEELKAAVDAGVQTSLKKIEAIWAGRIKQIDALKKEALATIAKLKTLAKSNTEIEINVDVKPQKPFAISASSPAGPAAIKYTPDKVQLNGDLTGPEQRILNAIAWMESIGVTEPEQTAVAFLAGYKYGGGAFNNPRGRLNQNGLVQYRQGNLIALTDEGRMMASVPGAPLTTDQLHQAVLDRLPGPEQKILKVLLTNYPAPMAKEELASASNYAVGGAFNNPLGRLRSLGLIEYPEKGYAVARPILFLD